MPAKTKKRAKRPAKAKAPKAKGPNILWHSNAPHAPTGYGNQTQLFTPLLNQHFRVGMSCFYGVEGNVLPWRGMPVFPALGGSLGDDFIKGHARAWFGEPRGGLIFTLMDCWALVPEIWSQFNLACWCPIDHDPLQAPMHRFLMESGAIPVAMSKFGLEKLREAGHKDALYVPHGVDTDAYRPKDRAESRAALGFDQDAFIVGMVAANKGHSPSRKCFAEAFAAFKAFADQNEKARLYVHTEASGKFGRFGGVNLVELAKAIGLSTDRLIFPDQYRMIHMPYPAEHMAATYSAMDVLLAPSMGEGFGIPVVEAQACGTPVIVTDFSAQPELCGAGWLVQESHRFYTSMASWQVLPDVADILEALKRAASLGDGAVTEHREKARVFAEGYDYRKVFADHMLPAMQECFERIGEQPAGATAELDTMVEPSVA